MAHQFLNRWQDHKRIEIRKSERRAEHNENAARRVELAKDMLEASSTEIERFKREFGRNGWIQAIFRPATEDELLHAPLPGQPGYLLLDGRPHDWVLFADPCFQRMPPADKVTAYRREVQRALENDIPNMRPRLPPVAGTIDGDDTLLSEFLSQFTTLRQYLQWHHDDNERFRQQQEQTDSALDGEIPARSVPRPKSGL